MIVGKWKPIILDHLLHGEALRFNELKKLIPDITQRMLTMHLRELEGQDILTRTVYPQVPPKVEYQITEYGMTLQPILNTMQEWGANHIEHMKEKER
ncbi:winged helix-turn-helix transcriptional regulator [Viridibacillus sp. NPDC096237]|uniref:winged helix-turn-helix transcriptional regulator n=1 Tax=Viridibacillus sp. NPDC096237 TaxID=3390721 RepID=UPI003D05AF9D